MEYANTQKTPVEKKVVSPQLIPAGFALSFFDKGEETVLLMGILEITRI